MMRVLFVLLGLISISSLAQEPEQVPDSRVKLAVEGEFWEARAVDANAIDVEVERGVVTLRGEVANIRAKQRAVRIAQMTRGVLSIVDQLTVEPSRRSDATIRHDVRAALAADPATDLWEIDVIVDDGAVSLSGSVASYAESMLAENIAGSVNGVREINNRLEIDYDTERPDAEIRAEIEEALEWDVRLDDALIRVDVSDGDVLLEGSVGSAYERSLAIRNAHVAGVSEVDATGLAVEWWRREEMQRSTPWADLSNTEIREAVERALAVDPRVNSFDVSVLLEDSTVTLSGVVDNLKAKRAAAQAAQNTVGVWRVKNYLKVRPLVSRTDEEIAEDIRDGLSRDTLVDASEVTLVVDDGEAQLYGEVDSLFEREQAEDVAATVNGVVNVRNHIQVSYGIPRLTYDYRDWDPLLYDYDYDYESVHEKSDAEIVEDIESEYFWSPFVDGDDIEVDVEDGIATLSGTVDDLYERRLAVENALEGGAYRVIDDLSVEIG